MSKMTELDYKLLKEKYKENFEDVLKKIENNYPIQYLIGTVDFYNVELNVNENVLIPRFETEYLVEKIIKYIKKLNLNNASVLDIGCGSGAISIALKKAISTLQVTALDISTKALEVTKENAIKNNVVINTIKMDILKHFPECNYDIVISNPPYVDQFEIVDPETKYEPQNAIFTSENGLIFYKKILTELKDKNIKLIAFEIGYQQGTILKEYAEKIYPHKEILIEKDLTGKNRFLFIK